MHAPPAVLGNGAECLSDFAAHLGRNLAEPLDQGGSGVTLELEPALNASYVLVHLYLVVGASERMELRDAIHRMLMTRDATQLHDLAYAIPTKPCDARVTAEEVWRLLRIAGTGALGKDREAWCSGDVVYMHYWTAGGPAMVAAAPEAGHKLPWAWVEQHRRPSEPAAAPDAEVRF